MVVVQMMPEEALEMTGFAPIAVLSSAAGKIP
jgi:hypothetical protein